MQLDITHFEQHAQKEGNPSAKDISLQEHDPLRHQSPQVLALEDECKFRDENSDITILPPQNKNKNKNQDALAVYRLPSALRGIDLKKVTSRAQLISALTQNIPLNEFNLPKFIYRPDVLDFNLFNAAPEDTVERESDRLREIQDQLDGASLQLSYHEGFPSLNGVPLWHRLPFESQLDFELFDAYLKIPGARQIAIITNIPTNPKNLDESLELYHLYYWGFRALAHDTFAIAHYQRLRQQRILSTENVHFLEAEKLLTALQQKFSQIDWTLATDPEVFVNLLEKAVKLQRLALGQSATNDQKNPQTPSLEVIMRNLTEAQGASATSPQSDSANAMEILTDPELTKKAQELIIRYNKPQ